jgi:hypothetical protein
VQFFFLFEILPFQWENLCYWEIKLSLFFRDHGFIQLLLSLINKVDFLISVMKAFYNFIIFTEKNFDSINS